MPSVSENINVIRKEVLEMMGEKEKLELQLKSFGELLESYGVSMDEPLVDGQDYPRNDIDVYPVRLIRNHIICTRNDLKALTERIEKGLDQYFAQLTGKKPKQHIPNGNCSLKPDNE